jgi:mRNA-degrading endonuclease RelE of RelBE toxin-antitoxin system
MLTGMHGVWRVQVAKDYRIVYTINDDRYPQDQSCRSSR